MKKKLKKYLPSKTLLSASLTAMSFITGTAWANTGTVEFSGSIVNSACVIAGDNVTLNVDMGSVGSKTLAGANSESPIKKSFTINLNGCDNSVLKGVVVTFNGTPDTTDTTALATSGDAQKVAIRFYDTDGSRLNLGAASKSVTLNAATTPLTFKATLISPAGSATPGSITATATYTLTYA
ncbi:fimbrial protein [Mixta intestinalis]|uniref:Putative fimbrial-like protein YcbV n=1 Tax=Mixta intestinalis TaxID=1615494 RepID=A0A6P1PW13_9GAMM|nr:fimbrial protein [Mixta intestinalis]QHM70234.1 putative fimbrial-like protein YcbV [Mixta intestinalis]